MTSWKKPMCKPMEHSLFKNLAERLQSDFMIKIEEDLPGIMKEMEVDSVDDILDKMGTYLINKTLTASKEIVDTEMKKRDHAHHYTVDLSYDGASYLKMTYDTMFKDSDLVKYKDSLLKVFDEITEFPKQVSVSYSYIVYDNNLILGYTTTEDAPKLSEFVGLLLDKMKNLSKTEALSKISSSDNDTKSMFKLIDATFDTLKQTVLSGKTINISNLNLLYERSENASSIVVHNNNSSDSVTFKQFEELLDKQAQNITEAKQHDFLSHISFK